MGDWLITDGTFSASLKGDEIVIPQEDSINLPGQYLVLKSNTDPIVKATGYSPVKYQNEYVEVYEVRVPMSSVLYFYEFQEIKKPEKGKDNNND